MRTRAIGPETRRGVKVRVHAVLRARVGIPDQRVGKADEETKRLREAVTTDRRQGVVLALMAAVDCVDGAGSLVAPP